MEINSVKVFFIWLVSPSGSYGTLVLPTYPANDNSEKENTIHVELQALLISGPP